MNRSLVRRFISSAIPDLRGRSVSSRSLPRQHSLLSREWNELFSSTSTSSGLILEHQRGAQSATQIFAHLWQERWTTYGVRPAIPFLLQNPGHFNIHSSACHAQESTSREEKQQRLDGENRPEEDEKGSGKQDQEKENEKGKGGPVPQWKVVMNKARQVFYTAAANAASGLKRARETKVGDSVRQAYKIVHEELTSPAGKRRRKQGHSASTSSQEKSDVTAIVVATKKLTPWQKWWEQTKSRVLSHPWVRRVYRVKEHPIVAKSHEFAEEMRDRWETSDSPVVHRIQDLNESIFGETATAVAMREVRRRDPIFSMTEFVAMVQEDVRPVLLAYIQGDMTLLRSKCRKEVMERCGAERRSMALQGFTVENKILHVSEVEVRETKLVGSDPVIILQFQTQQIRRVMDKSGKTIEGGMDEILTVIHLWAMQQSSDEEMAEDMDGPKWRLREMQQMGMQALI